MINRCNNKGPDNDINLTFTPPVRFQERFSVSFCLLTDAESPPMHRVTAQAMGKFWENVVFVFLGLFWGLKNVCPLETSI